MIVQISSNIFNFDLEFRNKPCKKSKDLFVDLNFASINA